MSPGIILIGLFVVTYGALAVVALRRPLLARLAYREVARRPWQSMLVVAGLTVGTSMLLMSFINSDSMTVTLTQATYQSWGRVDLLVSQNGAFFDRGVATRLADSPGLNGRLRGVQAGVELVGAVADLDRRLDNPTVRLLGFDPSNQSPFEAFTLVGGRITTGQDLPTDQVLVSKSLADSVQARTGDTLLVEASGNPPARFTVCWYRSFGGTRSLRRSARALRNSRPRLHSTSGDRFFRQGSKPRRRSSNWTREARS